MSAILKTLVLVLLHCAYVFEIFVLILKYVAESSLMIVDNLV